MLNPFVVDPTATQKPFSLRVTTDLFASPTKNAFDGSSTAHVQPTTASSITQQKSTTIQDASTTQQAPNSTPSTAQQGFGFITVTVYVTQSSGVMGPTGSSQSTKTGVGAPSSVASLGGSFPSGVAPTSGFPLSIAPFMKRSVQIRGRNMN
ncbi:hypothetical protein EYC80_004035 [Monilinia laxa]|nr:hypothetical protein EYC80_004035 [Monilinia laxa]